MQNCYVINKYFTVTVLHHPHLVKMILLFLHLKQSQWYGDLKKNHERKNIYLQYTWLSLYDVIYRQQIRIWILEDYIFFVMLEVQFAWIQWILNQCGTVFDIIDFCETLTEIIILLVYYTIPFGFSLLRHFKTSLFNFWNYFIWLKRKTKRSDSVLWQKPLNVHQQKCQNGKVTTQTPPQKGSITQRLRTDLGRSMGVTTATQGVVNHINAKGPVPEMRIYRYCELNPI